MKRYIFISFITVGLLTAFYFVGFQAFGQEPTPTPTPIPISTPTPAITSTPVKSLVVISPNGGEVWTLDSTQTISWKDADYIGKRYTVFITRQDGSGYGVAGEVLGETQFSWKVGTVTFGAQTIKLQPGSVYYVQIVKQDGLGIYDQSDNYFSIVEASPAPTPTPTPVFTCEAGSSLGTTVSKSNYSVKFCGNIGQTCKNGECVGDIKCDGMETKCSTDNIWVFVKCLGKLNDAFATHENCQLQGKVCKNGACVTESEKSLTLVSPNGGEKWETGGTYNIQWKSTGISSDAKMSLQLSYVEINSTDRYEIAMFQGTILNTGNYSWKISDPLGDVLPLLKLKPDQFLMRVIYAPAGTVELEDYSDAVFNIIKSTTPTPTPSAKSLYLFVPNGGETWEPGKTYEISWSKSGFTDADKMNIQLVNYEYGLKCLPLMVPIEADISGYNKCGPFIYKIIVGVPVNKGVYSWTVPSTIRQSKSYKLRIETEITGVAYPNEYKIAGSAATIEPSVPPTVYYSDESDNYFGIVSVSVPTPTPTPIETCDQKCKSLGYTSSICRSRIVSSGVANYYGCEAGEVEAGQSQGCISVYGEYAVCCCRKEIIPTSTPVPTPVTSCMAKEGGFCGGKSGIICCRGLICQYDGIHPDAGGKCVNDPTSIPISQVGCGDQCMALGYNSGVCTNASSCDIYNGPDLGESWDCRSCPFGFVSGTKDCAPPGEKVRCCCEKAKPTPAPTPVPYYGFRNAYWQCYDGTESNEGGSTSCKQSATWQKYADEFCYSHCYADKSKCGVNTFKVWNECGTTSTQVPVASPVPATPVPVQTTVPAPTPVPASSSDCSQQCKTSGYKSGACRSYLVEEGKEKACQAKEVDIGQTNDCLVPLGLLGKNTTCCCEKEEKKEEKQTSFNSGTIIKSSEGPMVYQLVNGKKLWIPSIKVFNQLKLDWSKIKTLSKQEFNSIPDAQLIRSAGEAPVYILSSAGYKRHLPNPEVFESYNFKWSDIVEVGSFWVSSFPNILVLQREEDYRVYKLEKGLKRWIKTAEAFEKLGYDWPMISTINKTEFNFYQEGTPVE